tara:strand:+ start:107 stop:775 length:669 start_codon:yes stop_codon:yes gene_type:complete
MPIRDTRAKRIRDRNNMIAEFEGFETNAYLDSEGIPTIGIGATSYKDGNLVQLGDTIDRPEAEELLQFHLKRATENLENESGYQKLPPNAKAAVDSFAFNVGPNFIYDEDGFGTINRAIRASDPQAIAEALPLYNNNETPGLVRRRAAEAELAVTPAMDSINSTLANDLTRKFGTPAVRDGSPVKWGGTDYGWQSPESFNSIDPPSVSSKAKRKAGLFGFLF